MLSLQKFACVPGTHLDVIPHEAVGSFDPITDPAALATYKATLVEVVVPEGCAIIFFQHIVHTVFKTKKSKDDSFRFMCGLYLTRTGK